MSHNIGEEGTLPTVDTIRINSGEYVCLSVLEVCAIPHISILSDEISADARNWIIEQTAADMSNLFTEIYQQYKEQYKAELVNPDVSLELIWTTEPVQNQPYEASIRLFIVLRSINKDSDRASSLVRMVLKLVSATLDGGLYDYSEYPIAEFSKRFAAVCQGICHAVVKEERVESLQNGYMPYCYAFDQFPTDYKDLSRLANMLIRYPDCAVSFQLIPTYYTKDELAELEALHQNLSMLGRGISDRQIGNISFANAERLMNMYKHYSDHRNRALFLYNIIVYGGGESLSAVSSKVMGQLTFTDEVSPNLQIVKVDCSSFYKNDQMVYPLPWVVNEILINNRSAELWNGQYVSANLYRFS